MPSTLPANRAIRPRLDAYIGADRLPGVLAVTVTQSVTQSCDSFSVALSLSQLAAARSAYDWAYWATIDRVALDLWYGFADEDAGRAEAAGLKPAPFFTGYADDIRIDPLRDQVEIAGRDASVLLLQTRISEDFSNLTSSQIATTLATRNGLAAAVTPTTTPSGRFYEIAHVRLVREQSEWDLLTFLAQQEGFETYVTGTTLHFGPKPPPGQPFVIDWRPPDPRTGGAPACNAVRLDLSRNLMAARGIKVTVQSWNAKLGRSFTATRTAARIASRAGGPAPKGRGFGGGRLNGGPQLYSFNPPGLDQAGVDRFAEEQLRQLSRHELRLDLGLGAEMTLDQHSVLRLQGTGTDFDQLYYPEEIQRTQSWDRGFTTRVRAKNHDTARRPLTSGAIGGAG